MTVSNVVKKRCKGQYDLLLLEVPSSPCTITFKKMIPVHVTGARNQKTKRSCSQCSDLLQKKEVVVLWGTVKNPTSHARRQTKHEGNERGDPLRMVSDSLGCHKKCSLVNRIHTYVYHRVFKHPLFINH